MSFTKSIIQAGSMVAIAALVAGCGNEVVEHNAAPTEQTAVSSPVAAPASAPVQASAAPAAKSVPLIEGEIPDYDGSGRGYLVNGNELQTKFAAHNQLPLGIFMPDTLTSFERNGNTAWGTEDGQNYITVVSAASGAQPEMSGTDPVLQQYKEYLGNYADSEGRVEVFSITAKGRAYRAEIRANTEKRGHLLPLFTNMLRDLQYMEKNKPLEAGVFVKEPLVGDSKEDRQMLSEVMNCLQAIAAKNEAKFNAAIHSPELVEALHYWVDNTDAFRFNELVYLGISDDNRRADFNVMYERMSEEGYLAERAFIISLLRNKQGEWKIANLD